MHQTRKKDNTDCFKLNIDDNLITDTKEIADTFNDYFVNIASKLKEPVEDCDFTQLKEHIDTKIPSNVSFKLPYITESFVFKFLSTFDDVSKSTGLDGIGPRLLKLSSSVITRSITYIAQACISKGYFPNSWKQAEVNPLYKGGAKEEINSYRPISILPALSKLLEKFIQENLMQFLNKYDVLHQSQSGFRSGHSTETALTLMAERWLKAINDGNIVGTIMVDFRNAFDLVDHSLLIKKLGVYKCSEHFIKLIDSYLCQRTQVVSTDGKLSRICVIKCGVPQGSVLGPLLFLIFINELPLVLSEKSLFDRFIC